MMIGPAGYPERRAEREIKGLFAGDEVITSAVDWARDVLAKRSIDPSARPVHAIHALRRADRRLGLVAARYLVDAVAGKKPPGHEGGRRRSPILE